MIKNIVLNGKIRRNLYRAYHMLGHSNRSKLHRNQERILNDALNWVDRNHRH